MDSPLKSGKSQISLWTDCRNPRIKARFFLSQRTIMAPAQRRQEARQ
jgi:hypothetical protein